MALKSDIASLEFQAVENGEALAEEKEALDRDIRSSALVVLIVIAIATGLGGLIYVQVIRDQAESFTSFVPMMFVLIAYTAFISIQYWSTLRQNRYEVIGALNELKRVTRRSFGRTSEMQ